ncbi:MAG: hypothetical protein LBP95_10605 [Deltaproteobacteria bacterium]|jgi:hypothetical protein|nr:hypothetical protein [Deltaproteobacteria bacterium]MDR1296096.1 hypothetical protein [Deltaproteobacteria bacterium]
MLVSSDFLGYLNRKKETEKKSGHLIEATLKPSPGGKEKSPPVDQVTQGGGRGKHQEDVEYLNERPSTVNVVL